MTQVGDVITDPNFPAITIEMARIVFEAIDPSDLHGFERAHYDKAKVGFPQAGPEHADQAWEAATTIADYLPVHELAEVRKRIQLSPAAEDADYAFTWDVYHMRVEFCEHEGIDIQTFGPLADYEPVIDSDVALEAHNAMAEELGVEPAPMAEPDNWRRYRLSGRVWGALMPKALPERVLLKERLSRRGMTPAALEAALAYIDELFVPSSAR